MTLAVSPGAQQTHQREQKSKNGQQTFIQSHQHPHNLSADTPAPRAHKRPRHRRGTQNACPPSHKASATFRPHGPGPRQSPKLLIRKQHVLQTKRARESRSICPAETWTSQEQAHVQKGKHKQCLSRTSPRTSLRTSPMCVAALVSRRENKQNL